MNNLKEMTSQEMVVLGRWSEKLNNALVSNYVTGATIQMKNELYEIYKRHYGRQLNIGCSACVLNMMKQLARLYNEELEKQNEVETAKSVEVVVYEAPEVESETMTTASPEDFVEEKKEVKTIRKRSIRSTSRKSAKSVRRRRNTKQMK